MVLEVGTYQDHLFYPYFTNLFSSNVQIWKWAFIFFVLYHSSAIQLLHLRFRDYSGIGARKIVKARGTRGLL